MAKVNPVKLKQEADKLEKAGKLEQAIAFYRQIVDDSPRDWNTINKIGDLLAKLNKFTEANEEYAKVADFYAKDGFHLKAIAIWKKINKLDPSALGPYVNLAELYAKQGLMMEAKSQFQIVVEEYIKRGKMRDAGEVLRKMAEIDPSDLKVRSKLADLYTREGNAGKAVEEHVAIAEELSRKGHLSEAVQVLDKGLKIDARSVRLRLELARVHLVQKNYERAAAVMEDAQAYAAADPAVLARLGEAYLGLRRIDQAAGIYQRLLKANPEDAEARAQMGRVHLLRGRPDDALEEFLPLVDRSVSRREGDKAAALLQELVQREPGHVKTLLKLAEVYRLLKQDSLVAQTYSQLTEAYIQQGHFEQAAGVLETLLSLEPYNEQLKSKLQFVRERAGHSPARAATLDIDEEFDLQMAGEDEFPGLAEVPARVAVPPPPTPKTSPVPLAVGPVRPRVELSGALSEQDREFVEEHLAEGKVFRKYGLIDKAADQFEAIVARFPDHVEARQELRDIYKDKGHAVRAAEQCLALAEVCRLKGDTAGAQGHEAQARELAPPPPEAPAAPAPPAAAPAAAPRVAPPAAAPVAAAPPPVPPAPAFAEEEELSFGGDEEEIPLAVEEPDEPATRPPTPAPALPAFVAAPQVEPEEVALDFGADSGQEADDDDLAAPFLEDDDALTTPGSGIPAAVAAPDLAAATAGLDLGLDLEEPAVPPSAVAPEPVRAAASRPAPAPPAPPAAVPAGPAVPPDLQRALDEVADYMSLGFVDDARDALREIALRHGEHPLVRARLAELGLPAAAQAEVEPPPALRPVPAPAPMPPPAPRAAPAPAPPAPVPSPPVAARDAFNTEDLLGPDFGAELDATAEAATSPTRDLADELEFPGLDGPAMPEAVAAPPADLDEMLGGDAFPSPSPPSAPGALEGLELEGIGGPAPAGEGLIDLGAELFGAFAAVEEPVPAQPRELGEAGLADIFREFKKGVDRQLGQEDYDTRYNLGIAYKEMGLVDEAIAEFQLAAKDPTRLLECSSMLGICFLDKGMPKLAVKWFERGLSTPGRSDEEYQGLRYDLACAYEADGDLARAQALFEELYGQDAQFRDVSERLHALRAR